MKIGFPKIPIPRSKESFDSQVLIGKQLINLHLMQDKELFIKGNRQVSFTDKKIDKYRFEDNKIYINKSSFISGVAESTWNMYIGGYQPIQKWLKERKGIVLSDDDVLHLLMIIQILEETSEKMIILDELYGYCRSAISLNVKSCISHTCFSQQKCDRPGDQIQVNSVCHFIMSTDFTAPYWMWQRFCPRGKNTVHWGISTGNRSLLCHTFHVQARSQ